MKSQGQWVLQAGWRNKAEPVAPMLTTRETWLSQQPGPGRLEDRTAASALGLLWQRWEIEVEADKRPRKSPVSPSCWRALGKGQQQTGWGMGKPVLLPLYTTSGLHGEPGAPPPGS